MFININCRLLLHCEINNEGYLVIKGFENFPSRFSYVSLYDDIIEKRIRLEINRDQFEKLKNFEKEIDFEIIADLSAHYHHCQCAGTLKLLKSRKEKSKGHKSTDCPLRINGDIFRKDN